MACDDYNHSMSTHTDIMLFDLPGLQDLMVGLGEKGFRAIQLAEWLYLRDAKSFAEMETLPRSLRAQLEEHYILSVPRVVQRFESPDGTVRYLLEMNDGVKSEAVAIPSGKRLTVCFSTQAGCAMGCIFCATGGLGLNRSLLPGEMLYQLSLAAADFGGVRISNVVAMGQGEPFSNYEATLGALRMMNSPKLFGIGARHITVSTAGLTRQIRRFAREPEQFTLAVSLHSAEQRVRDSLMPGLSTQPLDKLHDALLFYMNETSRRPSLEYALMQGVNDGRQALAALVDFCKVGAPGFHVNLLALSDTEKQSSGGSCDKLLLGGDKEEQSHKQSHEGGKDKLSPGVQRLRKSDAAIFRRFEEGLEKAGISVSRRVSRGEEIAAACGQLAGSTPSSFV